MSAFLACENTEFYLGIDPNKELFKNYNKQLKLFNNNGKTVKMVNECAEEYQFQNNETFDTILTSPPYYILENYINDEKQAGKRYLNFNEWMDNFLLKTIKTIWDRLLKNGYLIINISDIMLRNRNYKICDQMNDFIKKLDGANYYGCIGKRLSIRPTIDIEKNLIYAEPIWIWQKI